MQHILYFWGVKERPPEESRPILSTSLYSRPVTPSKNLYYIIQGICTVLPFGNDIQKYTYLLSLRVYCFSDV